MKLIRVLVVCAAFCMVFTSSVLAGTWKKDARGWWYDNGDGTWQNKGWFKDSDGKWYYFNQEGYMLADTYTPDHFYVNASGVWAEEKTTDVMLTEYTSTPVTVYDEGKYRAGVDVPAGEYVAFFKTGQYRAWDSLHFKVMEKEKEHVIKYNLGAVGSSNIIFKVEEGELFQVSRGTFSPISEVPHISYTKAEKEDTWLKVGRHIPAGKYKLRALGTSGGLESFKIYEWKDGRMGLKEITFLKKGGDETYKPEAMIEVREGEYLVIGGIGLERQ